MGKYIRRKDKLVADAVERERALEITLASESDAKVLVAAARELAEIRTVKTKAKTSPRDEFDCALHHKDGLPAPFTSKARVVVEVSAVFVFDEEGEEEAAHKFRDRPSYLVMCRKCTAEKKIVENLTDTLEEEK